ncbi:hypothetical protein LZK98_16570 [Sphingomonas cannabina]|uniref:hypothetical protein n=1 Tax=Sphingomonas cannabina TaxID=2899123 RepID=UPI001F3BEEB4|nr:hypothetical protein [Sphingomonas cannabina]UIJ44656.1 hypothetical protein LZK98_16570 [Sphingomonas cannabina]
MSVSLRPFGAALAAGIAATLCIAAAAAPAMARDKEESVSSKFDVKTQGDKICLIAKEVTTGSIMKPRTCKTREAWAAEGVKFSARADAAKVAAN